MIDGTCHCGRIQWRFDGEIERVTACNCTVCRRYGTLWAYGYKDEEIEVSGPTQEYLRGEKELGFHFCGHCGCVAYWLGTAPNAEGRYRIAVNARLATDPQQIQSIPIRHFDGLDKFEAEPGDDRWVQDMWY